MMTCMTSRLMKQSAALEAARLRLRAGFKAKFPTVSVMEQPKHEKHSIAASFIPAKTNLDAARRRLHDSVVKKYSVASMASAGSNIAMAGYTMKREPDNSLLEGARIRIRARFHDKFTSDIGDFSSFPRSVEEAMEAMKDEHEWGFSNAVVVTQADYPFTIVRVNHCWEDLCGYSQQEARGETFSSLGIQGSFTQGPSLESMEQKLRSNQPVATYLTNRNRDGEFFENYIRVAPLINDHGIVTHFVGVLEDTHATTEQEAAC